MSKMEQIILAALDRGPLLYTPHKYNGWHVRSPHAPPPNGRTRTRYFRTMDVRRVIESGRAKQIGNMVVRA